MPDPYALLGLSRGASPEQVTEAYRALAQIYHPDRYSDAPERVREESLRRMQTLNAAYDEIRSRTPSSLRDTGGAATDESEPDGAGPRRPPPPGLAYYVDGSAHYHLGHVAPLGLDLRADPVRRAAGARQCGRLNAELVKWFTVQRRHAPMTDKLLYASWDHEQQSIYAATVGCTRIPPAKAASLAEPCPECAGATT